MLDALRDDTFVLFSADKSLINQRPPRIDGAVDDTDAGILVLW